VYWLRVVALVSVLALAVAVPAFGALTPTQYRSQATSICKSTSSKLKSLGEPSKKSEVNAFLKKALPIFRGQWEALKKLDPPPAYRFLHLKVLSLEKQQIDGIGKVIKQIDDGADPITVFTDLDKKLGPIGDAETKAWDKLHVPACASL
jgi:hypothetical protein